MGTAANLIAIKNGKEYHTTLTTDGYMTAGGVNFIAIAQYSVDVLFELIRRNAKYALNMYQLGAVMPTDKHYMPILDSDIVKKNPNGLGEFFVADIKDTYSPLGLSTINYKTFDNDAEIYTASNDYNEGKTTESLMRTYILDLDKKALILYGDAIGSNRIMISFTSLENLYNTDTLKIDMYGAIDTTSFNTNMFKNSDEYIFSLMESGVKNYLLTLDALNNSTIKEDGFENAYLNTLKIWNKAYSVDEVIKHLGLQEVA